MEKEDKYVKLLNMLVAVSEAAKGTTAGEDERIFDAEGLLLKFFGHVASAFHLFRSTTIPELNISFFDPGSINVVGRAALESFLVFHYVFAASSTEDEKDFRYLTWGLAGLLDRQKYVPRSPQGREKLAREKETISQIQQKLAYNPCFKAMTVRQQNGMLKRSEWRLQSWTEIGKSAGLSDLHARQFYSYLCGYAHGSYLSVLQIRQADTAQTQKELCSATLGLIKIAMAFMVKSYINVFPQAMNVLRDDSEGARIVEQWIEIGSSPLENLDIDWNKVSL